MERRSSTAFAGPPGAEIPFSSPVFPHFCIYFQSTIFQNPSVHESSDILKSFSNLDHDRVRRTGIPEAVFAESKSVEQIAAALTAFVARTGFGLATRVRSTDIHSILQLLGPGVRTEWNDVGRILVVRKDGFDIPPTGGRIAVLAAGTSDAPAAEEARVTAETMGCAVTAFFDVGIAGIHRLLKPVETILKDEISVAVVVAGMEGALPSVVRGLVPIPVIGVPTSIGYGYGGRGEGALMTMLQSCSPGLTVVNIDNGFGAGATAALIANRVAVASRSK